MMRHLWKVVVVALMICVPFNAFAETALTEVSGGTYDFEFKAMTANITYGDSPASLKIQFCHRDTFAIYYATISSLPAKGAWVTQKYDFPSGIDIEDMKWMKLQLTGANSGNGWAVEEIQINDSTGTLYYEFDENGDGYDARPFIDGSKAITNGASGAYYAKTMVQLLPTPTLHADETNVRITLSTGSSVCSVSDVKFHLYPLNSSNAETFNAVDLNSATLTTNSTFNYDTTLDQRLGNFRLVAVENTGTSSLVIQDVRLYTKHDGGVWKLYTERDINDDGYDWNVTINNSSTEIPILGASTQQTWEATLASTDVVIDNFFQGHEVWSDSTGTAAAEASTYQTVDAANAGTSGDYNVIESSFYKVESGNGTSADLTAAMNDAAALNYTHVRYMVDTGVSPSSGSMIKYDTGGSVLVHQAETGTLKMHNKLVLVKDTNDGAAVLYGSSNLGTGTHGRWQAMTRISGVYDLWEGYDKYFANILKYDPSTDLADINHDHNTDAGYFGGTPNSGSEYSETSDPSTGSSSSLPWVHELGSAYDISAITLGDLELESWFYPRASTDQPIATVLSDLNTWLTGDSNRRAEVFIMHLYFFSSTSIPNDIASELTDLHTSSQADVFVGTAPNGDVTLAQIHDYRLSTNIASALQHSRTSQSAYEVHSKWIAIKKWHISSGSPVNDGFVIINGSRNMTDISLTERDENVTKIEWTASSGTASREFEQYVYRPYVDVFKRFNNHYDLSIPVGEEGPL